MISRSLYRAYVSLKHNDLRKSFSIQSHLTDRERYSLFRLAKECTQTLGAHNHICAAEIGSYLGASASFIAAGLRESDRLFCIDTWSNDAMSEGLRDTYSEFEANTSAHRDRITTLRGWSHSQSIIDQLKAHTDKIHLLFVDGDHSYEGVLADWTCYEAVLAPGAYVAMHDIGWAQGVQQVVKENIRPRVDIEHRLPNLWWGRLK